MEEKFKLGKKWFWIGIVLGLMAIPFGLLAALIYGIALLLEKKFLKEGLIIIGWSIIWSLIITFAIVPLFQKKKFLPSSNCVIECLIEEKFKSVMPKIGEPASQYLETNR